MTATLEQILLSDPSSTEAWSVYADWLQSKGDPRGDLVAAALAASDTEALLREHEERFLGPFAASGPWSKYTRLTWRHGFWQSAWLGIDPGDWHAPDLTEAVSALVRHDSARFLESLSLGPVQRLNRGSIHWLEAIDQIATAGPRPALRSLFLGDIHDDGSYYSSSFIGTMMPLWALLPNLEHLHLQAGNMGLGPIEAPKLASLRLRSVRLMKEPLERLSAASLPELRRLEIGFGQWRDEGSESAARRCSATDIEAMLARADLPKLTVLGLMDCLFSDHLPAILAASPRLGQLRELDLSGGSMTVVGAHDLVTHAEAFSHLERLDLRDNALSESSIEFVTDALPNVCINASDQRGEDQFYRDFGE